VTTEGGLDAVANQRDLSSTIQRLHANGIRVSLFIDPDEKQIDCATELGAEMVELHTGRLANAFTEKVEAQELDRLCQCAQHAHCSRLQVNAGHGINYRNIALIHQIPHLTELNIGHAIVSRAIFVGWENAVREMLARMENYEGG
jgi:pyridoxine 5-phosphate synthase